MLLEEKNRKDLELRWYWRVGTFKVSESLLVAKSGEGFPAREKGCEGKQKQVHGNE